MSDRDIFLLAIRDVYNHPYELLIIDAPNLEAALVYAKKAASDYFCTDNGWRQDKTEHWRMSWILTGDGDNPDNAHLSPSSIIRLNEEGEEVECG